MFASKYIVTSCNLPELSTQGKKRSKRTASVVNCPFPSLFIFTRAVPAASAKRVAIFTVRVKFVSSAHCAMAFSEGLTSVPFSLPRSLNAFLNIMREPDTFFAVRSTIAFASPVDIMPRSALWKYGTQPSYHQSQFCTHLFINGLNTPRIFAKNEELLTNEYVQYALNAAPFCHGANSLLLN